MTLQIDPRGVKLLVCSKCWTCNYVEENKCPCCGNTDDLERSVECASMEHNEPGGCDNPRCWKYHGDKIVCNRGGMQAIIEITDRCKVEYEKPVHTVNTVVCELSELGDLLKRIFNRESASEEV